MTNPDGRTDFNPKHRIIGAIILVSLAVIFVPMILDERAPPADLSDVSTIPREGGQADTRVAVSAVPREPSGGAGAIGTAVVENTPVKTADKPKTQEAKPAKQEQSAPAKHEAVVAKPDPKKSTVTASAQKTAGVPAGSGWMIQVGTFASASNALRLEEKLKKQGHPVSVEKVALENGKGMRLRVGPYREKELALRAQAQIQKETGLQGRVLAYP